MLTQRPDEVQLPAGVVAQKGDSTNPESLRKAYQGVDTLLVLNPVVPDELTRALIALRLASDFDIKGIVYFSMVNVDLLPDVPHAAAKLAAERLIVELDLPATILRPNYFMQNDAMVKDALLDGGVYAMPIGSVGASMVDIRDIAEVAALEILKRERGPKRLPHDLIDISGPEVLTADVVALIWTEVLGKKISYAGDDLHAFERKTAEHGSAIMAFDVALMFEWWQKIGVSPMPNAEERLTAMLGRPLRTYRAFAQETALQWQAV